MTKKKKIITAVISVAVSIIIVFTAILFILSYRGYGCIIGRALITTDGSYMIITETGSPVKMSTSHDSDTFFAGIKTGDKIFIINSLIEETYPARTHAYMCVKLANGCEDDIDSDVVNSLADLGWTISDGLSIYCE